jgi:hypothetical protein
MKDFYLKAASFFGTSFFHQENVNTKIIPLLSQQESLASKAGKDDFVSNEKIKASNFFKAKNIFQSNNENTNLNKTVYLLVSQSSQTKSLDNILLLIQSQDRLYAEKLATDKAFVKYTFYGDTATQVYPERFGGFPLKRKGLTKNLYNRFTRRGQIYYENKEGGYKSICPVFFDLASAQEFFQSVLTKQRLFHYGLPKKRNTKNLKGVLQTKIISLSLQDFLDYYSPNQENKSFEKVEFLFFPTKNKISPLKKINPFLSKVRKTKSFKEYQEKYYLNLPSTLNSQDKAFQENFIEKNEQSEHNSSSSSLQP